MLTGENQINVRVRIHARSKHYRLSISAAGEPILSVPTKGKVKDAEAFLRRQINWLEVRLKRRAPPISFVEGVEIPLRGIEHILVGTDKLRGQVSIQTGNEINELHVPGGAEHMARRLTDWLKKQALIDLKQRSGFHAERLGVAHGAISIRAQSTRWGSCSSQGNLSYNWRLILAPPFVLDYVAAHEVAHICEMNHSAAFWDKVAQTLPDMELGKNWLKANGNQLMGYGITPI